MTSIRHHGAVPFTFVLALGAVSASFTAAGYGWLTVWFQLFGETADRTDYAIATGAYAVGAGLLLLAPAAAWLLRLPLLPGLLALPGAAVLAALALSAHASMLDAEPSGYGDPPWTAGAVDLLGVPWMWILPVLTLVGLVERLSIGVTGAAAPDGA